MEEGIGQQRRKHPDETKVYGGAVEAAATHENVDTAVTGENLDVQLWNLVKANLQPE